MADTSPVDPCINLYDLVNDQSMWPDGGQCVSCDETSTGLLFDNECSEQFHGLTINKGSTGDAYADGKMAILNGELVNCC
jgi:hypothetical protein